MTYTISASQALRAWVPIEQFKEKGGTGLQVSDELKIAVRHFQWLENEYCIRVVQLEDLWKQ